MRRIIDWKALKTIVPYSRQHIARLEAQERFPRRVQLGHCRVGWFADEVEAWLETRPRVIHTYCSQ
jgi:prophage regulatory protein